jgi:VWFA-related protein
MLRFGVFVAVAALVSAQVMPTFRTDARLVEVQVVVTERGGAPALGLKEGDFTVLENGKPQKIAFFVPPSQGVAAETQALPPGVFTNRPEYAPRGPRAVAAIVLDVLNTHPSDQAFARAQVARFLKSLQGDELIALYVLGANVRVIHDFTDDPASLSRLVRTLKSEWPAGSVGFEQQTVNEADVLARALSGVEFQDAATSDAQQMHQETRMRTTLHHLEMIGEHLAGVPGRKTLAWVSSGIPMLSVSFSAPAGEGGYSLPTYRSYSKEVLRAVNRLADANVAVYPIDARGLRPESDTPAYRPDLARQMGNRAAWNTQWQTVPARETLSAVKKFAEATGGRAFYNTNDLEGGMRRAAEDLKANYTLAYYTALDDESTKRELQVKVNRPGVDVLARRRVPAGPRPGLIEVKSLLDSPLSATGVLLNAQVTRREGELRVALQIEPGSLLLTRQGDRTTGVVEVYLAQIRASGERSVSDARLDLRLSDADLKRVADQGLIYEKTVTFDPAAERLRVVVRDTRSGAAGTFDAPFARIPIETGN